MPAGLTRMRKVIEITTGRMMHFCAGKDDFVAENPQVRLCSIGLTLYVSSLYLYDDEGSPESTGSRENIAYWAEAYGELGTLVGKPRSCIGAGFVPRVTLSPAMPGLVAQS